MLDDLGGQSDRPTGNVRKYARGAGSIRFVFTRGVKSSAAEGGIDTRGLQGARSILRDRVPRDQLAALATRKRCDGQNCSANAAAYYLHSVARVYVRPSSELTTDTRCHTMPSRNYILFSVATASTTSRPT